MLKKLTDQPDGEHYQLMGNAVWLFLYLLVESDPETKTLQSGPNTIGRALGVRGQLVHHWLDKLEMFGYIKVDPAKHPQVIHILSDLT